MNVKSLKICEVKTWLVTLPLSLVLFGCGGGGTDTEEPPNAAPTPPPVQPTPTPTPPPPPAPPAPTPPAPTPPAPTPPVPAPDPDHPHDGHCANTPDFAALDVMTHMATQSGPWSSADTWGGSLPVDGANVHIPTDINVTLQTELSTRVNTVRIDGSLMFSPNQNTQLNVETLFSSCSGTLQIGTATQPIEPSVSARVIFIDDGAITDAKLLSRGAVLMGQTIIHGAQKTHKAVISPQARAGDTQLTLTSMPQGWQIDDQLVITGTVVGDPRSDEIRTINQVDGNRIALNAPLERDHTAPMEDLNVYVANTSRNVEFISENTQVSRRGHIMFMHTLNVDVQNVRFTELGRTDKTRPLDDFQFEFPDESAGDDAPATANVIALGGSNIRGRYAVHFHQGGIDQSRAPALIKGSVVFNGPGWGFVNHSSNVDMIDNVAYGQQGAGFYTEAGNEIGSMQGNIAIRSANDAFALGDQGAIDPDISADRMDYGNDGDGFWLTGNRVSLINNVSAGATAHGFIYWTDGVMEPNGETATRVTVAVSDVANSHLIPNRESIPVWWAPMAESRGNESYGATIGFRIRYVHAKNYLGREEQSDFHRSPPQAYIDTLDPSVNDLVVWGNRDGVLLNYNERMRLNGARIVGFGRNVSRFEFNPGTAKEGVGLDYSNDSTHGPAMIENVTIEGYGMGFAMPVNGEWQIRNITLRDNQTDLLILDPETEPTQLNLQNVQFTNFWIEDGEEGDELPEHVRIIE